MESVEFGNHISGIINSGLVCLSLALGKEVGLLECLCDSQEPLTVRQIADKLDLKERYVKEWLGAMVAASIVDVDGVREKYYIHDGHKPAILNGVTTASILPLLSQSHDEVKRCFKKDGPQGFEYGDRFHAFFDESWKQNVDAFIEDDILAHLPKIREQLDNGCTVCDVGCGTGSCLIKLGKRFPKSSFNGIDISPIAVEKATHAAKDANLENVTFRQMDASKMATEYVDKFNWILAIETIHYLSDPINALAEMKKALKADGTLSIVEFQTQTNHYENKGKLFSGAVFTASTYLCLPSSMVNNSSECLGAAWGIDAAKEMLRKSGFSVDIIEGCKKHLGRILFACSKT